MCIPLLLSYVGPEVVWPLASVIAAVIGFFLVMGRTGLSFLFGFVRKPSPPKEP